MFFIERYQDANQRWVFSKNVGAFGGFLKCIALLLKKDLTGSKMLYWDVYIALADVYCLMMINDLTGFQ
jgi:hypothetical protein